MVVAWGRKSYLGLAEISSLVFLVSFKDGTQGESRVLSLSGLWSKTCRGHKFSGSWFYILHAGNGEVY